MRETGLQHIEFGQTQSAGLVIASRKIAVELGHDLRGGLVIDLP